MSGLSTKHVVLGLLIERPGYGYDLQQRIESRLAFLQLSPNAVYNILDRLERDGWIEELGEKHIGRTRRGAARVMYRPTADGREQFEQWMAMPSDRLALRDELLSKCMIADPSYLPELLRLAERQAQECVTDLAGLERPVLAHAAQPDVPWNHAAVMMADDLKVRWIQTSLDWLEAVCEVIEERIDHAGRTSPGS